MAIENVELNEMTGGSKVAVDTFTVGADTVAAQIVKIGVSADGDVPVQVSSTNPLPITGTVTAQDGGGSLTVDGAVTVTNPIASNLKAEGTNAGTFATQATLAAETTKVIGTVNVASGQSIGVTSGTAANCKVEATIAASQTLSTVTTVGTVTTLTGGGVAHDGADSGNPVKIGTKCESTPSAQVVADGDRSDILLDMDGAVFVRSGCTIGDCLVESISNTNGNATAFSVFTTGSGIRNVITDIVAYNSSATAGYVIITDGSGGTTLMTVPLPAGGGAVINLQTPIKSTANTALYYDVSGALTTVYLTVTGYRTKVS
jgi:hypothetical protein